jgi:hypothetical protein
MGKSKVRMLIPCKVIASPQKTYKTVAGVGVPTAQPDLLYMRSVLVSTGSNKNDDVFLPDEMWKARSTPVLKPVDWEHNMGRELTEAEQKENPGKVVVDNQTIGVMYNAYVTDEQGQVIDDTKASAADFEIPERFDIVDEAVIWKGNFPAVASRIEKGAAENTLFVSMEAWFNDYDYLVGNRVVARNEETSFLDDSLRASGGSGAFGSSSVKRILRNLTFGGKGIVETPANEPSIIQSVTHAPIGASEAANKVIAKHVIDDLGNQTANEKDIIQMSDNNKVEASAGVPLDKYTAATEEAVTLRAEVKTVSGERDAAKAENADLEKQVENISSAFVKGAKLLDTVLPGVAAKLTEASSEDFFSVLVDSISASNTSIEELEAKLAEATKTLEAQAAEAKSRDRLVEINKVLSSLLTEENVEQIEAKAAKMLSSSDSMNDESFAAYLDDYRETVALAAKAPPFKKKKDDDEEEMDDDKSKASDDGETDASILDNVIAAEQAPSAGDTPKPINFDKAMSGLVTSMLKSSSPQAAK